MVTGADPPLTSVNMYLENIGRVAAEHLLLAINRGPRAARTRCPAGLVIRDSTGTGGA